MLGNKRTVRVMTKIKQLLIERKDRKLSKKMQSNIMLDDATEPVKFLRGLIWCGGKVY